MDPQALLLYEYQALPEQHIRIIVLQPAKDEAEPLSCTIETVDINQLQEQWDCVSYNWGGQEFTHSIICHSTSRLAITLHLHEALRRFRSATRPSRLWADAVCINQKDDVEKSKQIPLMGRIYGQASRVLIWLGRGGQEEARGIEVLHRISKGSQAAEPPTTNTSELEAVQSVIRLPWFSRRWIIQELVLNPEAVLYYGLSRILWSRFLLATEILNKTGILLDRTAQDAIHVLGDQWKRLALSKELGKGGPLLSLLHSFHSFECADDRDKIYALAGLASDGEGLEVNYSRPSAEIYRDFALQMLTKEDNVFEVLAYAGAFRRHGHEFSLGSWVPDWSAGKLYSILFDLNQNVPSRIKVDVYGDLSVIAIIACFQSSDCQNTHGLHSPFVEFTGPRHPEEFSPDALLGWIKEAVRFVREHDIRKSEPPDVDENLFVIGWTVAAGGRLLDALRDEARNAILETNLERSVSNTGNPWYEVMMEYIRRLQLVLLGDTSVPLSSIMTYLRLVWITMTGRRLVITNIIRSDRERHNRERHKSHRYYQRNDYRLIAIAPADVQEGDLIVQFASAMSPFFFRPCPGGFRLLGDGIIARVPDIVPEFAFTLGEYAVEHLKFVIK
jgi:hypothetical protein